MSEDDGLKEFFAVTETSLYRVVAFGEDGRYPCAEKLALKGDSKVLVGATLKGGSMLAIAKHLQFYFPEAHSILSPQTKYVRELELVNNWWWQGGTSLIIALFLKEKDARDCFAQQELLPCDVRWIDKTKEVLEKIGENHPTISICHWHDLSLMSCYD
jgi:hypothetical protein